MVIDTSRPGWTVLHADCNNAAIDCKNGEGQSLWDLFKVPDVVGIRLRLHNPAACINTHLPAGNVARDILSKFVLRSQIV